MNNDSAAKLSTHRIRIYPSFPPFSLFPCLSRSLLLFLSSRLSFCLNIYFPPTVSRRDFCLGGERRRRQLYEINASRLPGAFSPPANKRKSSLASLVFWRIKKSSIPRNSSIFFAPPARHISSRLARIPKFGLCRWSIDLSPGRQAVAVKREKADAKKAPVELKKKIYYSWSPCGSFISVRARRF